MKRITDRLFVGGIEDCQDREGFGRVCACRTPCWKETQRNDGLSRFRLALDLQDLPVPAYDLSLFTLFLGAARGYIELGNSLLIHCLDGRNRSTALACLFCAKVLGNVPNDSFDSAWRSFEQKFYPDYGHDDSLPGLRQWLRENWDRIPRSLISHIEGAPQAAEIEPEKEAPPLILTPEQLIAVAKYNVMLYFTSYIRIMDKDKKLTPKDGHVRLSPLQMDIGKAYQWCMANDVPVRLIGGPKPRQSHSSTITAALCLFHTFKYHCDGMLIGDEGDRTRMLWQMFNEMAQNDRFDGWGTTHEFNADRATFRWAEDGQARKCEWLHDTASDKMAGGSGARQILWMSEAGKYAKSGVVTDTQIITNAMSSVPDKPGTLVIIESVAEGAAGYFFDLVKGAVTLKERMAGKRGNGWIKCFRGWHEVPEYRTPRTDHNGDLFQDKLDADEQAGVERYRWTAEQIAWRRQKIKDFKANRALFRQEFPANEQEAFQASGSPRFEQKGLERLARMAETGHAKARLGSIVEQHGGAVQFLPAQEVANKWLWLLEAPIDGCRYIVFGDFMTAEQSEGSEKRDGHATGVIRLAYTDSMGRLIPEAVVAAFWEEGGIRWETTIITRRIHLLSKLFGDCIIAMETNQALGILALLLQAKANMWKRDKDDDRVPGQTRKIEGWQTNEATRDVIVTAVADFVYEQHGECKYLPLVRQMETFIRKPNGRCEAGPQSHDDWVMGFGIGLACKSSATTYAARKPDRPFEQLQRRESAGEHGSVGLQ